MASMTHRRRLTIAAILLLLAAVPSVGAIPPAWAQTEGQEAAARPDAPLNERILSIPGNPAQPVVLQVTLYTPNGPGPFPLAVMNHGATAVSAQNRGSRYHLTFSAYYFLSRGYAVVLPMMRGFAGSGGSLFHRGCDLAAVGVANAKDISAVIDDMARQPYIDASRIVIAGQSFGGWNTLAFGTLGYRNVKGLINFSGGVRDSSCPAGDASLAAGAAYYGAHTSVPSLWFYGENDQLFPVPTWRAMYARYTSAGGHAELVDYGAFMSDSHQMLSYSESLPMWTRKVDAFLTRIGLPGTLVNAAYLPTPLPPPTNYAPVDDANAVPYIGDKGRALYQHFLADPLPRVFVIAPDGTAGSYHQGFDPQARALRACGAGHADCQIYAVDHDVVWRASTPVAAGGAPQPRHVNATVPGGKTTTLDMSFAVNPDCSSRGLPKLWITQRPAHGSAQVATRDGHPRFAAGNPYAKCNTASVKVAVVDYTPTSGFTGTDLLGFEEIGLDHRDQAFLIAITVK
jgi:dienelactone hydrolase